MMKSFQLSYFQLLYLLTAALLECKAETKRPCKQVHQLNISHLLGDSMYISCQTTTHPLDSLTVKLRSINQDKVILMSPDISPASEHQRWSVRNDAGNVTLDLKDIRSSDSGLYDCQVYKDQDCLHTTRFNLSIIKCKTLNSVHAMINSSVLLPCSEHPLQNRTEPVTWKVVNGHQSTDVTQYRAPFKPSSSTEKPPDPLGRNSFGHPGACCNGRILGDIDMCINQAFAFKVQASNIRPSPFWPFNIRLHILRGQ
ncbi:uncharacterized protein LOC113099389 [Carassius auratus]|uniref:Uncharacterized protein LOC113099389 n=1 Tax=Carassius auratus TaxID=7957 RepID=A0A6P6PHD2_CARAU|nr:uncharacterized protein LOC113099389 [Carassius auratus]